MATRVVLGQYLMDIEVVFEPVFNDHYSRFGPVLNRNWAGFFGHVLQWVRANFKQKWCVFIVDFK